VSTDDGEENPSGETDRPHGGPSPEQPPWWHSSQQGPEVDSVLVEGLRLASALRDWAVESGAVAAVADLTQTAASSASAYLSQVGGETAPEPEAPMVEHSVRCSDCPVCQGLDALDRTNPQWSQAARSALAQVNALIAVALSAASGGEQAKDPPDH
jgi:hypothetical protein